MNRNSLLYLLMGIIVILIVIVIWRPCPPCPPAGCERLSFDQQDGVGTFLSFSREPTSLAREPEIAPARIRARAGEQITWVIRNPSDYDISVGLHSVVDARTGEEVMSDIFTTIDPPVKIGKGCRIAPLQGTLNLDIPAVAVTDSGKVGRSEAGCDSARVFHYFFMVRVLTGDTPSKDPLVCKWPYDPELVVERDP